MYIYRKREREKERNLCIYQERKERKREGGKGEVVGGGRQAGLLSTKPLMVVSSL